MKVFRIILFFLFVSLWAHAQQGAISGHVLDKTTKEPVEFASVRLLKQTDSTFVKGASTNVKGYFNLSVSAGKYRIEISFLGYKTYKKEIETSKENLNFNFGNILLVSDSLILDEAVVTAKVPDVVVRGDTIEYNADSFTSNESDLLQDIVKRLPGVELDLEGNLKANGKRINKILVDGKEFFGNDIKMALQNLPANIIKKLQLFKEESETSKITGFKDGKEEQVLNLTIKDEYKRNLFGDARIGYGNKGTYSNRLMTNYMHDNNQFSLIGGMSKVAGIDMANAGVYSAMSGLDAGIDKDKSIGANFSVQQSEKFKITSNIRYSDNSNLYESKTRTESFFPNRINLQNSSSTDNRKNLNAGTGLEWKPDSLTRIFFRLSGGYGENSRNRKTTSDTYAEGKDSSFYKNLNKSNGDLHTLSSSLVVGRQLSKKGRNISFSLNGNIRKDDNTSFNNSLTTYSSGKENLLLDQKSINDTRSNAWAIGFTYVEPLSEKQSIMLGYSYRQSSSERDGKTFNKDDDDNFTVLDTDYSRYSKSFDAKQNINLSFQSIHDKFEYSVGFNIDPSYSKRKVMVQDSIIEDLKQRVVNYSPTFRFAYKPKSNSQLEIDYLGSSAYPGITQLAKDTIRSVSGTSKSYGNPDLKASYNNSIRMSWYKSDFEKGNYLFLSANLNYTFNNIANFTKVDTITWNTESTYKNVNGNWNANIGVTYNTPFRNKKFSVMLNSYVYYSQYVGFSNELKNTTKNWSFNEGLSFYYKTEKINSNLQFNYSYSITRNDAQNFGNTDVSNFWISNYTTIELPFDFNIQNSIRYSYNGGYSSDFKKTEILWNASISKLFLKKKKGTLKLQFNDILKDRSNVSRVVTNDITDTRTNAISRYFLLSFSYRFNISKGKSESEFDDFYY